jgi:hypothetical protein
MERAEANANKQMHTVDLFYHTIAPEEAEGGMKRENDLHSKPKEDWSVGGRGGWGRRWP